MNLPASSTKNKFTTLLEQIARDFPSISFTKSDSFHWSSETRTIFYDPADTDRIWSLLHELGHMEHNHSTYNSDTQLITMEVEAWKSAVQIAPRYGIDIDEDHIQDCLDSYRAWRHARSKCPVCSLAGIEVDGTYRCINCRNTWRVSDNRFCRAYRMQ